MVFLCYPHNSPMKDRIRSDESHRKLWYFLWIFHQFGLSIFGHFFGNLKNESKSAFLVHLRLFSDLCIIALTSL